LKKVLGVTRKEAKSLSVGACVQAIVELFFACKQAPTWQTKEQSQIGKKRPVRFRKKAGSDAHAGLRVKHQRQA